MANQKIKTLARTALMIALIFVGTFSIRIPNIATGGYFHMGDSMIFLGITILGKRNGSIAAALGGALSDLLCGATIWIIPTLIIKFIMAWIMAICIENKIFKNLSCYIGAILGGIFQIIAYTIAEALLFTWPAALGALLGLILQTLVGFIIFSILFKSLHSTKLFN